MLPGIVTLIYAGDSQTLVSWDCDFISKVEDDFRFLEGKNQEKCSVPN